MKIRTLFLATAVLASASGYAFAQTSNGTMGGTKAEPDSSKPMASDTMSKDKMMKPATTGMETGKSNSPMSNGNVSPASPNSGEKQQK